jgi:hypothetical protein
VQTLTVVPLITHIVAPKRVSAALTNAQPGTHWFRIHLTSGVRTGSAWKESMMEAVAKGKQLVTVPYVQRVCYPSPMERTLTVLGVLVSKGLMIWHVVLLKDTA